MKRKAKINQNDCVACGSCVKVCRKQAITIYKGRYANVDEDLCVGCGLCVNQCPASFVKVEEVA